MRAKHVALLVSFLPLVACSPLRGKPAFGPLTLWKPSQSSRTQSEELRVPASALSSLLRVGDDVVITTSWDGSYGFAIYRVDSDAFAGRDKTNKKYKVLYKSIAQIEVRRNGEVFEYSVE